MLFKTGKRFYFRLIALITLFFYINAALGEPAAWAGSFEDSVNAGHSMGTTLTEDYNPANLNTTLQNKGLTGTDAIVPQADTAKEQQSSQSSYYTNPSSMTGGSSTDIAQFVTETKDSRATVDMTEDSTFGYKCQERDTSGKCLRWSSTEDILHNIYKDCETIIVPVYDDPPTYKTCTGTNTSYQKSCSSTTYVNITTETIDTPCSSYTPEYQSGQIYAQCKDYYKWYKTFAGTGRYIDDCYCGYHGEFGCFTQTNFTLENPPPGATYIATSFENPREQGDDDGWDGCTEDTYNWYYIYDHSAVERLFLMEDTTCPNLENMLQNECAVEKMNMCDPTGSYCYESISDYAGTGSLPDFNDGYKLQSTAVTDACRNHCDWIMYPNGEDMVIDFYNCEDEGSSSCSGLCLPDATLASSVPAYFVYAGTQKIISDTAECDLHSSPMANPSITFDTYDYYINGFTCKKVSGAMDNYRICLKYDYILITDSYSTGNPLTTTPERTDWSTALTYTTPWGITRDLLPISHFAIRGGPDVRSYRNIWKSSYELSCNNKTNDCDALISQGCAYDSTTCNDEYCTDRIFTYKCGGTGALKEYEKTVVCAGNLRCMGTDCKEVIKVESGDFGEAAAAGEILNMIRIDSAQGQVFPGDKYECQDAPKNCCDESVGGVSIGDYIIAAKSMYTIGSAAAEAYAPAFYEGVQAAVSYIPGMATEYVMDEATGTLVEQSIGQATKEMATEALTSVLEEAGMTAVTETGVTSGAAAAGAVISAICTVLWVLAILYALYTIIKFLFNSMFSCDEKDMATSVKLTLKLCHLVGKASDTTLGMKLKSHNVYCCFNSILARVIHEQGRPQVGRGWGTVDNPDCSGLAFGEMEKINFSEIDLSEYMQYVTAKTALTDEEQAALIEKATNSANNLKNQ